VLRVYSVSETTQVELTIRGVYAPSFKVGVHTADAVGPAAGAYTPPLLS
jgi:hypothetical protein